MKAASVSGAVDPELQYVVTIELEGGDTQGMTVHSVRVRRVAALGLNGAPVLVPTDAAPCIGRTLQRLELPPGLGPATFEFDLRYYDCISQDAHR